MEKVALTRLLNHLFVKQPISPLLSAPLLTKSSARSIYTTTSRPSEPALAPPGGFVPSRPSEILFNSLCDDGKTVTIETLLKAITKTGLRQNDPRLRESMHNIMQIQNTHDLKQFELDHATFRDVIQDNVSLINRALRGQFVLPEFADFVTEIDDMYWKQKTNIRGKVADYIPQLARANPDNWGVSICTVDGQRHSVGDVNVPFCLQSCSKPLTYAIAISDSSPDVVHRYVGQEPSGRSFNFLELDYKNQPHNPMINAGAIVTCSLVKPELNIADRFDYVMSIYKKVAGGEFVGFNNAVFQSERVTADRNFALGYYMRENKCFPEGTDLMELCSVEVNCESGSVMAATLANGGINPLTGERVLNPVSVRNTLSLMHSCGMYDYSGQFAFKVGLPAKSGVAGTVLIVIPNVLGLCCWSPPLDEVGNSARGVAFSEELVSRFNFHHYDNLIYSPKKTDPRRKRKENENVRVFNLLFSAYNGELGAMKRFHLSGFNMETKDYDGRTALHLAAAEGHLNIVKYLLEQCNVSPTPLDRWGGTPLDEAERGNHTAIVELLRSHS